MLSSLWRFFPDYRASNPYQALLGQALDADFDIGPACISETLRRGEAAATIFHLHWEDAIYAQAASHAGADAAMAEFLSDLRAFQERGGRAVWTVHNAAPHEDRHPGLSAAFRRSLAERMDLVHVHGATAGALLQAAGAPEERLLVVPHPHFRDAYPDDIDDAAARKHFGLGPHNTVFVFFGAMRAYKGLDRLTAAFASVHATNKTARLILAGRPGGPHDVERIAHALGPACAATHLMPRFVDDCAVQYVMRAADYVVLPYRNILTSGAMILALGFGRPVIVPAMPALLDVVTPDQDCIAFAPHDDGALLRALGSACAQDAAQRNRLRNHARFTAGATSFMQLARALRRWAVNAPRHTDLLPVSPATVDRFSLLQDS